MNIPTAEQRFMILQQKDLRRRWRSLDDKRICVLCHRLITGRDIRITENGDGEHDVHCPTESCAATPADWLYYGSALAPSRPAAQETPQRVEVDLNFS